MDLLMEHGADPDKQDEVCTVDDSRFHLPVYIYITQRGVTAFEVAEVRNFQDLANKLNPQQVQSCIYSTVVHSLCIPNGRFS